MTPAVRWNDDAIELAAVVEPAEPSDSPKLLALCEPQLIKQREIAAEIFGDIDWHNAAEGFCTCPGQHLHTTSEGERDCKVFLDQVPTVYCFHDHCRDIVEKVNCELRSRIEKAEHAASYPVNDSERAVRFANRFGSDLRYVATWKSWLRWNETRWARDEDGGIMRLAQEIPKLLLAEAAGIESLHERSKAANAANRAGDAARLHAMIQLAGAQSTIATTPQMFDADPYLLSVKNGVIDLRTGRFRDARKEDYLTKQTGTEHAPDAKCPRWSDFLNAIFREDASLIEFVQMATG
jgi:hypothetical protein